MDLGGSGKYQGFFNQDQMMIPQTEAASMLEDF
jgi:hypothetical protein